MRTAIIASLVLIGLISLGMRSNSSHRRLVRVVDGRKPVPAAKNPKFVVEGGWMVTDEDAKQDALQEAQLKLIGHLRSLEPPVSWTPPLKYIDDKLVRLSKTAQRDFQEEIGMMRRIHMELELSATNMEDIRGRDREHRIEAERKDREYRSQDRMLLLAKGLGGLVACLAALAGYVHLDERTKGYYTNWLRLGAFGFVTAAAGGLWCLP